MSKNLKSIILIVCAVLLAALLPVYSVVKKVGDTPSENFSNEFYIKSIEQHFAGKAENSKEIRTASLVVGDSVYSFSFYQGELYADKIDKNFKVVKSTKLEAADNVWNMSAQLNSNGKIALYTRGSGNLRRYFLDKDSLQVIGDSVLIDKDVKCIDTKDDYLLVVKEDAVRVYLNEKLVLDEKIAGVSSAKFAFEGDEIKILTVRTIDNVKNIGLINYDDQLQRYTYKNFYTEGLNVKVGNIKSVFVKNDAIYAHTVIFSYYHGVKYTHMIVCKIQDDQFKTLAEIKNRQIQSNGLIYDVENDNVKMILLMATRSGVEYFKWDTLTQQRGEKLTLTINVKDDVKFFDVDGYKTLFCYGSKNQTKVPFFTSTNPELIEKSKYIGLDIYVNAFTMFLNSFLFSVLIFGLFAVCVVIMLMMALNLILTKFTDLNYKSNIRFLILSVVPLVLSILAYGKLCKNTYPRIYNIDIFVNNILIFAVIMLITYAISYIFAGLRSFEVVNDDDTFMWITNFSIAFVVLFVANFWQYEFLQSFISNIV